MARRAPKALRHIAYQHRWLYRLLSPLNGLRHNWEMLWPRLRHGIDPNLVVFSSYQMHTYSDNPRYISEALHALRPETEIVWLTRHTEQVKEKYPVPDYVRCVEFPTKESSVYAGRAQVLVDNWRKRNFIRLGRRQVYVFSPHYDRGFKRAAKADSRFFFRRVVEKHCSLAVIGSDVQKPVFQMMYDYKGEFLIQGLPRNDILVRSDPEDEIRIRKKLGVDMDTGLLLYAPTYRDRDRKARKTIQNVDLDLGRALNVLEETTGKRWLCLYRAHYFMKGMAMNGESERLIDATDYPEMAELLRVSDALITDYSSCAGDYALRYKPIYLYQADIEEYRSLDRDLLIDPADTPFWRAESPEALDALIRETTPEKARENCQAVLDYFGTHESGHASELVAKYIADRLGPAQKSK